MSDGEKQSFVGVIVSKIKDLVNDFWRWLKPNPNDHWLLQILKSIAKLPLVLLLILCSPILIVVLLLIFLIAL